MDSNKILVGKKTFMAGFFVYEIEETNINYHKSNGNPFVVRKFKMIPRTERIKRCLGEDTPFIEISCKFITSYLATNEEVEEIKRESGKRALFEEVTE